VVYFCPMVVTLRVREKIQIQCVREKIEIQFVREIIDQYQFLKAS
jgi:hypothetical protein